MGRPSQSKTSTRSSPVTRAFTNRKRPLNVTGRVMSETGSPLSGATIAVTSLTESFFLGQALGLASFVPGGFGSSDVFWIAHVGLAKSAAAAALMVYRLIYYIVPWAVAYCAWVVAITCPEASRWPQPYSSMFGSPKIPSSSPPNSPAMPWV